MKVVVTRRAEDDLLNIFRRIATDNPKAALATIQKIDEAFARLREFPFIGRARPMLGHSIRSLPVGLNLIFYTLEANSIQIIRVLDGRRDIGGEFER